MSTIVVVDVITQYFMTFGPLLGDIKKEGAIPLSLDRLSINIYQNSTIYCLQGTRSQMSDILLIYAFLAISFYFLKLINFLRIPTHKLQPHLFLMGAVAFCVTGALGALGRRFESCRPDQSETFFPACLFYWRLVVYGIFMSYVR